MELPRRVIIEKPKWTISKKSVFITVLCCFALLHFALNFYFHQRTFSNVEKISQFLEKNDELLLLDKLLKVGKLFAKFKKLKQNKPSQSDEEDVDEINGYEADEQTT
ncbi:uncharacterized protein LOC132194107 [Neocloeon triangulifer]|uniref:uncharacterized protein LOC132194107 n=1 Tax=Neocloeon triangulifer TaxID=2078957 RepID=UPI00286F78C8|nr:uncharacterized protein LOC132194107 [Neocloeon triangulifer]